MFALWPAIVLSAQHDAPQPTPGHPIVLPTEFIENRFNVVPITADGKKLRFFTDSAGTCAFTLERAEELKLAISKDGDLSYCAFPPLSANAYAPPNLSGNLRLFSQKDTEEELGKGYDGMLGQNWFGGGVWTFDYPGKQLLWRASGDLPKHEPAHEVKLYFKTDAKGVRQTNFARIVITVDGEPLSFTVDTGATDYLTPAALKIVNDGGPSERATSFLAQNVYDRWHAKHPNWRVVTTRTGTGLEMIEAPKVTISGFDVGPVWFSVQPDATFHKMMAQYTDQPTEGSLGGSAYKYFRMTIDWPNALAVFEKP